MENRGEKWKSALAYTGKPGRMYTIKEQRCARARRTHNCTHRRVARNSPTSLHARGWIMFSRGVTTRTHTSSWKNARAYDGKNAPCVSLHLYIRARACLGKLKEESIILLWYRARAGETNCTWYSFAGKIAAAGKRNIVIYIVCIEKWSVFTNRLNFYT